MPEASRSAYEILGVPKNATTEEIKKKYRELARKHHPDVNGGNPAATELFSRITDAYKTLSDPDNRSAYDADQDLKERQAAQRAARAANRANSTGYTPPPPTGAPPSGRMAEVTRLVAEARNSFSRGHFLEARMKAEQALRITSRNAEAYEILGDVYRIQGKNEQAMNMYSMALQINPRNYSVMQRLERVAKSVGGTPSPTAQRVFFDNRETDDRDTATPRYSAPRSANPIGANLSEEKKPLGMLLVGFIGYAGVFLLMLYAALFPGEAPRGTPILSIVSTWNATILMVLSLCGLLMGATMTITGAIRRIEDEVILGGISASSTSRAFVPIGLLMCVVSVFSFYIAAAIYAIYAMMQDSFTRSMQRVFIAVVAITCALAAVYIPGHFQVLLFGGNVVFLTFIIGWLLGDFFRPD